jgi:hypothetical protein
MEAVVELLDEVNVKIHGLSPSTRKKLYDKFSFILPYARHTPAFKMGRWDGKKNFFALGGKTYINLLEDILEILLDEGYEVGIIDNRIRYDIELDQINVDHFSDRVWPEDHVVAGEPVILRDYQHEIINNFLSNQTAVQEVATGAGKCQPYHSKILTTAGWKQMGDLTTEDKVIVPDGSKADIINIYEPGKKDIYKIVFSDGRKVECCGDHLWPIHNIQWRANSKKGGPYRNITTTELIELMAKTKRNIGIPLVTMKNNNIDIELPMDPWLLGFLLGDGSFSSGAVSFSTADTELVEKVSSKIHKDYIVNYIGQYDYSIDFKSQQIKYAFRSKHMKDKKRNKLGHIIAENKSSFHKYRQILIKLVLGNLHNHNKFIPEIYHSASYNQRMKLIQGLVDSAGTIDKSSVVFTSTSNKLASGFQKMIHSVGGIAKIKYKTNRTYKYKGDYRACKDSYTVATKFPKPWELCSLARKKDKTNYFYQYGQTLKLNIDSIEKIGNERVRCIYINHPDHLYITDNYIVTHNTLITAALSDLVEKSLSSEQLTKFKLTPGRSGGARTIVIVPNISLVTQTEEDYINLGLDVGVYYGDRKEYNCTHTICTWQSLEVIYKNFRTGKSDMSLEDFTQGVMAVIVDECFDGNTRILTPDGERKISELTPGDKVINLNITDNVFKEDTIIKIHENLVKSKSTDMIKLEFNEGTITEVTSNHEFLTDQGWIRADHLTEEMEIINILS